jgi:hypothetical protein
LFIPIVTNQVCAGSLSISQVSKFFETAYNSICYLIKGLDFLLKLIF